MSRMTVLSKVWLDADCSRAPKCKQVESLDVELHAVRADQDNVVAGRLIRCIDGRGSAPRRRLLVSRRRLAHDEYNGLKTMVRVLARVLASEKSC